MLFVLSFEVGPVLSVLMAFRCQTGANSARSFFFVLLDVEMGVDCFLVVPRRFLERREEMNGTGKRERDFWVKGDEKCCQIRRNWGKALV